MRAAGSRGMVREEETDFGLLSGGDADGFQIDAETPLLLSTWAPQAASSTLPTASYGWTGGPLDACPHSYYDVYDTRGEKQWC